ncbi:MAG: two-component sensor histidine kinase, partial [Dyella sp.]
MLAAFLGIVGLTLTQTNKDRALGGLREQLQKDVIAYLAAVDVNRFGRPLMPSSDSAPDPDFSRPGSGLYAVVGGENGFRWSSPSA